MALYKKAADILDKVEQKRGAVKTLVYDSKFQVGYVQITKHLEVFIYLVSFLCFSSVI